MQGQSTSSLWVGPMADFSRAQQLPRQLTTRGGGDHALMWTPDGRIVYASGVSGNSDLWIMNHDGSNPRQLTDSPAADLSRPFHPTGAPLS